MGRFACWLLRKNSITAFGFCLGRRQYTMNRKARIPLWFFKKQEKMRETPEVAPKKVHSIFHGMDFFRPVCSVFGHFSHEKEEKTASSRCVYYTTARNIWELQHCRLGGSAGCNYTTARNICEVLYKTCNRSARQDITNRKKNPSAQVAQRDSLFL